MSAQDKTVGPPGRKRVTTWLAWGILGLAVVFILLLQWVFSLPHPHKLDIETSGNSPFAFLGGFAFSLVGTLIVSRYPRHPIGWIYCIAGLMVGLTAFTTGYAQYAEMVPGILPSGGLASAISDISFVVGFMLPITFGLLLFPDGHLPSRRWTPVAWLTALGFALSFVGFPFFILVFAVFASAASLILRWRRAAADEREQLKWVGAAAVALIVIWLVVLSISIISPGLAGSGFGFLLATLAFALIPVAVGIAILKYRLYDIDLLINRTLVYVPLTAILAGIFAASITLSQKFFVAVTGQASDAATALTTLIVVALFEPLKTGLQHLVDKRFKEARDPSKELRAFGDQVRAVVQVLRVEQLAQRLVDTATGAFDAQGGVVILGNGMDPNRVYASKNWNGETRLSVPLEADGKPLGQLKLGARLNAADYTERDRELLRQITGIVGQALEQHRKE